MASRKASKAMRLAQEILRRQAELEALRREFDRVVVGEPAERASTLVDDESIQTDFDFHSSASATLTARIRDLLARRSPFSLSAPDIATALAEPKSIASIRAILSKMLHDGAIERVATGQYRIPRGDRDDD